MLDFVDFYIVKIRKKMDIPYEHKRAQYFLGIHDISQALIQHGNMRNWSRSPKKKTFT